MLRCQQNNTGAQTDIPQPKHDPKISYFCLIPLFNKHPIIVPAKIAQVFAIVPIIILYIPSYLFSIKKALP